MRRCPILVVGLLLVSGSVSRRVAAQPTAGAVSAAGGAGLTSEQMQAFADLTGDSPNRIAGRFALEPHLVPLAAQAADARMSRKTTGKIMAIVGFTILGVGDIAGTAILVTTPGYPSMEGHESRFLLSAGVMLGSLAVGLALGIPGILKIARTSEEEEQALAAYTGRRSALAARPSLASGRSLLAPLFGLAF